MGLLLNLSSKNATTDEIILLRLQDHVVDLTHEVSILCCILDKIMRLTEYYHFCTRRPGSSTVYMRIVFLDSSLRIVKNEADGKTFIYGRSY